MVIPIKNFGNKKDPPLHCRLMGKTQNQKKDGRK
jgi:hypothetical protein